MDDYRVTLGCTFLWRNEGRWKENISLELMTTPTQATYNYTVQLKVKKVHSVIKQLSFKKTSVLRLTHSRTLNTTPILWIFFMLW